MKTTEIDFYNPPPFKGSEDSEDSDDPFRQWLVTQIEQHETFNQYVQAACYRRVLQRYDDQ